MKIKGVWFYGYSGSGKTYSSKYLSKFIKHPFIIDGDDIRKNISYDLGYDEYDRIVQTKRVLGLAKITIAQKFFPIISTSYLNSDIAKKGTSVGILVVQIIRNKKHLNVIKFKGNILGSDIKLDSFKVKKIINDHNIKIKIKSLIDLF